MRQLFFVVLLSTIFMACDSDHRSSADDVPTADASLLVDYMQGFYSSKAQSQRDTNFLDILLVMEPIWTSRNDGAWMYVEQAATWTPKQPYRQRIYQLEQVNDTTFTSTIYKLKRDSLYIGAHRETEIFNTITPDSLELLEGCALTLHFNDSVFTGSTDRQACTNTWGEATYATSEATIYADSLISWDRGYNETGEQVWGSETGGYHFVKMKSGM